MNKFSYDILNSAYQNVKNHNSTYCELVMDYSPNELLNYINAAYSLIDFSFVRRADDDTFLDSSFSYPPIFKFFITSDGIQHFVSEWNSQD